MHTGVVQQEDDRSQMCEIPPKAGVFVATETSGTVHSAHQFALTAKAVGATTIVDDVTEKELRAALKVVGFAK